MASNDRESFFGKLMGLAPGTPSAGGGPVPHSKPVSICPPPHGVKTHTPASPVSHPEMVFTPSDVGIWEVNRISRTGSGKGGLFSSIFGGGSAPAKD